MTVVVDRLPVVAPGSRVMGAGYKRIPDTRYPAPDTRYPSRGLHNA